MSLLAKGIGSMLFMQLNLLTAVKSQAVTKTWERHVATLSHGENNKTEKIRERYRRKREKKTMKPLFTFSPILRPCRFVCHPSSNKTDAPMPPPPWYWCSTHSLIIIICQLISFVFLQCHNHIHPLINPGMSL